MQSVVRKLLRLDPMQFLRPIFRYTIGEANAVKMVGLVLCDPRHKTCQLDLHCLALTVKPLKCYRLCPLNINADIAARPTAFAPWLRFVRTPCNSGVNKDLDVLLSQR